jgi:hypothetical protein
MVETGSSMIIPQDYDKAYPSLPPKKKTMKISLTENEEALINAAFAPLRRIYETLDPALKSRGMGIDVTHFEFSEEALQHLAGILGKISFEVVAPLMSKIKAQIDTQAPHH